MDTESVPRLPLADSPARIGPLASFTSTSVEAAYRQQHLRHNVCLCQLLVGAGMLRVSLLLVADYQHFGLGLDFWRLLAVRLSFLVASACVLLVLRRAARAATADRVFFGWCAVLAALTAYSLSARPAGNTGLLLMSFGMILIAYCVTPLPLSHQLALGLSYSAAVLYGCRQVDGRTLLTVGLAHGMSNLFGAVTSWQLNRRQREAFLSTSREAELRAHLEEAAAEIRTLRGMLCICAWCKRVRDEAEDWEAVEDYVQSRTHASFTHGICPACFQSQLGTRRS